MMQGGPLMQGVAAKAVALKEAATPEYAAYARQVIANAQALTEALAAEGMRPVTGGTDTHLALLDLQGIGVSGRDAEARCDRGRHRAQQERHPVRPPAGVGRQRHPGRHPQRHDAGDGRGRDEGDRRRSSPGRVRDEDGSAAEEVRRGVAALVDRAPRLPPELSPPPCGSTCSSCSSPRPSRTC